MRVASALPKVADAAIHMNSVLSARYKFLREVFVTVIQPGLMKLLKRRELYWCGGLAWAGRQTPTQLILYSHPLTHAPW